MSKRASPTAIGAFVVSALALAMVGIITLGGMQLFKKELPFVMFFDGDVGGLDVGSPLEFRGVKIGKVTKIRLFAGSTNIGVYVNIDPSLLPKGGRIRQNSEAVAIMIKEGLKAQLKFQSFVTGQLLVSLDVLPRAPVKLVGLDPDLQEIPTIQTSLARLQSQMQEFFDKLDKVKLEDLVTNVTQTLQSAKDLMASPELKAAVVSAHSALQAADKVLTRLETDLDSISSKTDAALLEMRELLVESRKFLANVDAQIEPLSASIKSASTSAQGALQAVDRAVDGDSRLGYEAVRALRDVADAARSLKALADYLERHPDALLRGKGGPESK